MLPGAGLMALTFNIEAGITFAISAAQVNMPPF